MQLSRLHAIQQIERKELTLFFSSAIGYLFLATFLLATLFIVFWFETYFARNIADVRPMFEWLPILLIFLSAALTMRMWRGAAIGHVGVSHHAARQLLAIRLGQIFCFLGAVGLVHCA